MRKLFLHAGFAKCGSTSLQAALSVAPGIVFPKSGNHGGEHLALALALRGVDDWTRQFFDEAWAAEGLAGIMREIRADSQTVVLSSERLAALSEAEIARLRALFADFSIEVILVRRDLERYLSSTWRHAAFRHDFGESYDAFRDRFRSFRFDDAGARFGQHFKVHEYDMDAPGHAAALGALIGTTLVMPRANVGVPMGLATLLQQTHARLGTAEFTRRFDARTKAGMLAVWTGDKTVRIDPMTAPLF